MLTLDDLKDHLNLVRASRRLQGEERQRISEACDNIMGCDPWKYEPFLLDELFLERNGNNDTDKVHKLRGLIRAGSWMTYPRLSAQDAEEKLNAVRRSEQQDWEWRMRHADPDTAKEIKHNRDEQMDEFQQISSAIRRGDLGESLEDCARNIEGLLGHDWYELKKNMAAKGLNWKTAPTDPITARLFSEIQNLRELRDYVYHRLLYPKWARRAQAKP